MLYAKKDSGVNRIASKSIIASKFGGEIITGFEIQTQEVCNLAMEAFFKVSGFETEESLLPFVDITVTSSYEIGDHIFTYVAGRSGFARSEKLFVCKRNRQIYYQEYQDEKWFPKLKNISTSIFIINASDRWYRFGG